MKLIWTNKVCLAAQLAALDYDSREVAHQLDIPVAKVQQWFDTPGFADEVAKRRRRYVASGKFNLDPAPTPPDPQ